MSDVYERAAKRLVTAHYILSELKLIEQWATFGQPVIVGSVAHGLVVAPDIDIEIYSEEPQIDDGFRVLSVCAHHQRVTKARFANELRGPDQGLYWQLRYQHEDGEIWKIDMWSLSFNHPGPLAVDLVEPMAFTLTDEMRGAILGIKEHLFDSNESYGGIYIYRAVIEAGVRSVHEFYEWLQTNQALGLTDWKPGELRAD